MPAMNHELRAAIIVGYSKGETIQQIADANGTTYDNVRATAHRMKLNWRKARAEAEAREMEFRPKTTPQYDAWLKAREGAARTLQDMSA